MGVIQDGKLLEMDMSNDLSLSFAKKNLYLLLKNDDLGKSRRGVWDWEMMRFGLRLVSSKEH